MPVPLTAHGTGMRASHPHGWIRPAAYAEGWPGWLVPAGSMQANPCQQDWRHLRRPASGRSADRRHGHNLSAHREIGCPPTRKSRCPLTPGAGPGRAVGALARHIMR